MLQFDKSSRFDNPGPIPDGVVYAFSEYISKIVAGHESKWRILELFKRYFGDVAGIPASTSSSVSWAETDLERFMGHAAANAPLFIDAFYSACQDLESQSIAVPDVHHINRTLAQCEAGYEIRPPDLVATRVHMPIPVPEHKPSFDEQVTAIIDAALDQNSFWMTGRTVRQFRRSSGFWSPSRRPSATTP
jgi:hypothetical protein